MKCDEKGQVMHRKSLCNRFPVNSYTRISIAYNWVDQKWGSVVILLNDREPTKALAGVTYIWVTKGVSMLTLRLMGNAPFHTMHSIIQNCAKVVS